MKSVKIGNVYTILRKQVKKYRVPVVDLIEVQTRDPFKVLLATILSARTQDRTTSRAAHRLFSRVKRFSDLERLSLKQIERLIYPVGFYKTKARHLKKLAKVIKTDFNNKIPFEIEDLIKLPGVGRKTANLVMAIGFKKPAVCVDTHVHRIMNRLGYVKTKNPYETEMALRMKLPKKYWRTINSMLVAFGQNTCKPISPYCSRCVVRRYCNRIGVKVGR